MTISGGRPPLSPPQTSLSLQENSKHYNFDIKVKKEYYEDEHISHSQESPFYSVNNNIKAEKDLHDQQHHHIESNKEQKMLATHPRLPVHLEYLQPHITVRISYASFKIHKNTEWEMPSHHQIKKNITVNFDINTIFY